MYEAGGELVDVARLVGHRDQGVVGGGEFLGVRRDHLDSDVTTFLGRSCRDLGDFERHERRAAGGVDLLVATAPGDGILLPTPVYHPLVDMPASIGRRLVTCPLTAEGRLDLAAAIAMGARVP